jgi:penicillin-binding protein 2
MVGPNAIAKWAKTLGLDRVTGIDLPGEVAGLIPTPEWKKEVKKESWFLGNTYHMSIGQGDVTLTPIEVNTYISAIAGDGNLCKPHFNLEISGNCKKVDISKSNIDLIKEGMKEACRTGGTAYTFFDFSSKNGGQEVACKTGTAEVGTDGTPHAWFTVFAPAENPQIVATVLIEKGGEGSSVAGPIARKIIDYWAPQLAK